MRAIKDKKRFGKDKKPKNRNCKVFGYSYPKESRKYRRKLIRQIKHKLLFRIPLNEEEIGNLWWVKIQNK